MAAVNEQGKSIWPRGWLLVYSVFWMLVAVGIGYEAFKDYSTPLLISSLGFAVVAALLFARSRFAIPANIAFSVYLICLGLFVWYRVGQPGYLIGAVLCFASTWVFRDELLKQQ